MEELPQQIDNGDTEAVKYLEQLLNEGRNEGINEAELQLPSWYDAKLFKEGQSFMNKYRFYMSLSFLIGFIASLSIPSILKILTSTQQSDTPKKAYRRYIETILHTMAWYSEPLEENSKLWESLSIVRSSHLRASKMCTKMQVGRITQKDLVLTQFSLIGFLMLGVDQMGLNDTAFLEATTHMWRVLGYLLGIKDEYNVCEESWKETKPRFKIIMERVFQPALVSAEPEFHETTDILLEGLRPLHMVFTGKAAVFFLRRWAGCEGYEVLDSDFPNGLRSSTDKSNYHSLGLWDRMLVAAGVVSLTHLYKYTLVRWYLNAYFWINQLLVECFPYLAIWRYGSNWAYVRIFKKNKNK